MAVKEALSITRSKKQNAVGKGKSHPLFTCRAAEFCSAIFTDVQINFQAGLDQELCKLQGARTCLKT